MAENASSIIFILIGSLGNSWLLPKPTITYKLQLLPIGSFGIHFSKIWIQIFSSKKGHFKTRAFADCSDLTRTFPLWRLLLYTKLIPVHFVKSVQLNWRLGTRRFHLRVKDLLMTWIELTRMKKYQDYIYIVLPGLTQRAHDAKTTSLWRQIDVATTS